MNENSVGGETPKFMKINISYDVPKLDNNAEASLSQNVKGGALNMQKEPIENKALNMQKEPIENKALNMQKEPIENKALNMQKEPIENKALNMQKEPIENKALKMQKEPIENKANLYKADVKKVIDLKENSNLPIINNNNNCKPQLDLDDNNEAIHSNIHMQNFFSNDIALNMQKEQIGNNSDLYKADINYIFDFKENCNLTIINNNNKNCKPSLRFYIKTFDNYIKETENALNLQYKNMRKKMLSIPQQIRNMKVIMLLKLLNEVFKDDADFILNNRFAKGFENNPVKKKICYVIKLSIPVDEQAYIDNILKQRVHNIKKQTVIEGNEDNHVTEDIGKEDDAFLKQDIMAGLLSTLENIKPDVFNSTTKNYSSEEYKILLEESFVDVNTYNSNLYSVFKDVLSNLNLNFVTFVKTFCLFLQFAEELYTKIIVLGKEIHVQIFCDDEIYLEKAELIGYCLELSDFGKKHFLDTNLKNKSSVEVTGSILKNIFEDKINNEIIQIYTKDIFVPYTINSADLFKK